MGSSSKASRTGVVALVLSLPCAGLAAEAPRPATPVDRASPQDIELSEVIVSGEKPTRKVAELIPWLRRLVGQYTFSGYVDLGGKGLPEDRKSVRGGGTCVGFGVAPGVQCEIQVRWPETRGPDRQEVMGGVSYFLPAMILYGLEPDEIGIRYLQVDNRGLAEGSTGFVIGATGTFRTPCVDFPAGSCTRVVKITADPDSSTVEMQIDTEIDYQLAMRFRFQMLRVAQVQDGPGAIATP